MTGATEEKAKAAQFVVTDEVLPGSRFCGTGAVLSEEDIARAARDLDCEQAAVRAVLKVEARGRGFDRYNRVAALFEPHKFHAFTKGAFAAEHPDISSPRWNRKLYPTGPHGVYEQIDKAFALDPQAALKSTSWGLGQIMGSNSSRAGHKSAREMVRTFMLGEPEQLRAMVEFIRREGLDSAIRSHDWETFARRYNGPGHAKNGYVGKLQKAYQEFSGHPSFSVLRRVRAA